MRLKIRVTPMGLLEVLMWGSAAAIVCAWLFWPGFAETAGASHKLAGRAVGTWGSKAVAASSPLETGQERTATRARAHTVTLVADSASDGPEITGTTSPLLELLE